MPERTSRHGELPQVGYVRQSQLIPHIIPISSATLWRKVADGTFPAPVKLSPRVTAWEASKVRLWIDSHSSRIGELA
jgi:predicted DNA-binding transcriptional regulator AlpA